MTVETVLRTSGRLQVISTEAAEVQRGDQVAFASPDGEPGDAVAGEVTGVRRDPARATVTLVVANRVHFVPVDHRVTVIRGCAQQRPARTTPAGL